MAVEPFTLTFLTVSVKSSTVFSWLSISFAQSPSLLSVARSWLSSTVLQMSAPLAELASLASVLSVVATRAA